MLAFLLILLVALWLLGYVTIPGVALALPILVIGGLAISLWDILVFGVIVWVASILPTPLRQIAWVIVLLWVLAALGILTIAGLPNILIVAVILGIILTLFNLV